jgi:hypothetical protein
MAIILPGGSSMPRYTPLVIIEKVKDDLGITYEEMARRIRKRNKKGSPVGAFLNQLALGMKRCSPDMATSIAKAFPDRIHREDLIWPVNHKQASNA